MLAKKKQKKKQFWEVIRVKMGPSKWPKINDNWSYFTPINGVMTPLNGLKKMGNWGEKTQLIAIVSLHL